MLKKLGYDSLDQLTDAAVPASIQLKRDLGISKGVTEYEVIQQIKAIAEKNKVRIL